MQKHKSLARLSALALPLSMSVLNTAVLAQTPEAAQRTFTNPVVARGADPWVLFWNGAYYYCRSGGGKKIWVHKAAHLEEIGTDDGVAVWTPPPSGPYSKELWAPELHNLDGKWYVYVAADDGNNHNHRMYVLEGDKGDPQAPFAMKGKIADPSDRWAIDGTVLTMEGGQRYFIWSGWEGAENVQQNLYIAAMSNAWTISGERVCISQPDHDWEKNGKPLVNEGPSVLKRDGKVFVVYSASGSWTDDYCLGLLTLNGDPMQKKSWVKKDKPVFCRTKDVFGPGHCSFTKALDEKEDWIVYHAERRKGSGWDRDVRMQRFTWNADGSPDFGAPLSPGVPMELPKRVQDAQPALK
ncbi:MAG TPA: glycoside hydrolase family 43 protein [Planctomycetota bacterium]|jgi:GH43 family beta-xylosidase